MRNNLLRITCLLAGAGLVASAQADRSVATSSSLVDDVADFLLGGVGHSNQGYLNGPEHSNQGGSGGDDGDEDQPGPSPAIDPLAGGGAGGPSLSGGLDDTLGDVWVSVGEASGSFDVGIDPLFDDGRGHSYTGGQGTLVPEPATLLLIGFGGLLIVRRR